MPIEPTHRDGSGHIPGNKVDELLKREQPNTGATGLPTRAWRAAHTPAEFEHRLALTVPAVRIQTYRKMRRTSMPIRVGGETLRSAVGQTVPMLVSNDDTDAAAIEHLERQFGLGGYDGAAMCRTSLAEVVKMAIKLVEDGAVFIAPEWELVDGKWWIVDWHIRHIDSIAEVWTDKRNGRLIGIRQRVDGEVEDSWVSDLLYLVYLPEQGGVLGEGLLRTLEPIWEDEQHGYNQQRAGIYRYATATPLIKVRETPEAQRFVAQKEATESGSDKGWIAQQQDLIAEAFENLRAGLCASIVIPWWAEVEYTTGEFDPEKLDRNIGHRQRELFEGFRCAWLAQGRSGSGGALAMIEVQRDEHRAWTRQIVESIYDGLNAQICAQIFAFNFPSLERRRQPRLWFSGLEAPKTVDRLERIEKAKAIGIFTPQTEDERQFREEEDLTPMADEVEELTAFDRSRIGPSQTEAGQRAARERRTSARDILDGRSDANRDEEEANG